MVEVFREVRRVLRPDGTLWLILGVYSLRGKSFKTAALDFFVAGTVAAQIIDGTARPSLILVSFMAGTLAIGLVLELVERRINRVAA
jgi:hypothetical protein